MNHVQDALLATAFSPELRNPRLMAEMKIDLVTRRGVQLSTMVMQVGVIYVPIWWREVSSKFTLNGTIKII